MAPQILKLADELDADLRHSFSDAEIETFEHVLRTLAGGFGKSLKNNKGGTQMKLSKEEVKQVAHQHGADCVGVVVANKIPESIPPSQQPLC